MDYWLPREVDSENETCVFNSMFKEHTLERSDYSSDFRGLIRFLYAKHFMRTAAAESSCIALPLCDEAIDEDVILDHRLANGFTMLDVSFDLATNGYLVGTSSIWQFPKRFSPGNKVTFTRSILSECFKETLTIKGEDENATNADGRLLFVGSTKLPDDFFEGHWRLDLCEEDYVLGRILKSILEFTRQDENLLAELVCNDSLSIDCRKKLNRVGLTSAFSLDNI